MKAATVERDDQIDAAVRILARLREQGWTKASVEVTRGGTLRIDADTSDGGKIARPQFGTGLRK